MSIYCATRSVQVCKGEKKKCRFRFQVSTVQYVWVLALAVAAAAAAKNLLASRIDLPVLIGLSSCPLFSMRCSPRPGLLLLLHSPPFFPIVSLPLHYSTTSCSVTVFLRLARPKFHAPRARMHMLVQLR
ncbi:hypothetical protein BCV70DRAFT_92234 [Testicularia cyperi]|uniref:Uncharacterized protein n=1 Tax=Testicularia cyperi TaxID=1882483 RepID=A0A317XEX4_9BASI|nr:hypothetical protein BCV70DRAFT_92234 [Testicularia cyperi]